MPLRSLTPVVLQSVVEVWAGARAQWGLSTVPGALRCPPVLLGAPQAPCTPNAPARWKSMGPDPEWAAWSGAMELARWTLTMNLGSGNQGTQVRLGHQLHVASQGEEGAREQGECKARGDSKLLNVGT